MFETIINLLTRFVEAHERLATAYETFLGEHSARMEELKTETLAEEAPKEKKTRAKKAKEDPQPEAAPVEAPQPETAPVEEQPAFVPTPDELKAVVKAWAVANGGLEAAQNLMSEVSGGRARKLAEIEALEDAEAVRCALFARVKGE